MSAMTQRPWTGRTALFLILSFFGVVFAANGVFLYLAASTWNGLSTDDAYRKGLNYNRTIERAAAQRELGWRTAVSLEELGDGQRRLTVLLHDRTEQPINNRAVTAMLRRPVSEDTEDIEVSLNWAGAGLYATDLALPEGGHWDVRVEVAREGDLPYLIETRLWPN